jgi:hypothetical protein
MLDDDYSLWDKLKIICNAKNKYKPIKRSSKYPWLFMVGWLIAMGSIFGVIDLSENLYVMIIQGVLMVGLLILFMSLVFRR